MVVCAVDSVLSPPGLYHPASGPVVPSLGVDRSHVKLVEQKVKQLSLKWLGVQIRHVVLSLDVGHVDASCFNLITNGKMPNRYMLG